MIPNMNWNKAKCKSMKDILEEQQNAKKIMPREETKMEDDEQEDDSNIDTSDIDEDDEDVNYEAAKDLEESRRKGVKRTCWR